VDVVRLAETCGLVLGLGMQPSSEVPQHLAHAER
jgi:hypothetical protein